ncbi:MAG: slipin family protein, partial [Candidatus Kapabacteria bacterium]|nr:slipin family protein [Candidatus Kapabacteria bacterium]
MELLVKLIIAFVEFLGKLIAMELLILLLLAIIVLTSALRILNEYERGVIFRLGRLIGSKGPGL